MSRSWMDGPSELGIAALHYIAQEDREGQDVFILDIGCGNGRDAFYLSKHLDACILGIDTDEEKITEAQGLTKQKKTKNIDFKLADILMYDHEPFDILFCSGVYHFLRMNERMVFREKMKRLLKPGGLLFMSTLSVGDLTYYRNGRAVSEESNSFLYKLSASETVFLHFCTQEEILDDFSFLSIKDLYEEREYDPMVKGPINYIPWVLIAEY